MKDLAIDKRSERMLELLSQGVGTRMVAKEMGYQYGTMRVYLHNLYRKLGVANKTEAVIWYLRRGSAVAAAPVAAGAAPAATSDDPFGDMALAEGLFSALGVMGAYLGPWGRVWEVGARLSGEPVEDAGRIRQAHSRALWNALLKGDFASAKAAYDADEGYAMLGAPPGDALMMVSLLAAGGYSHAARQLAAKLTDKRRARTNMPAREAVLLGAVLDAFEGKGPGVARLQKSAEGTAPAPLRQLAMVLAFHASRSRKESERSRQIANALWAEAEEARKELQAMGDRPLGVRQPTQAAARVTPREKAAVTR